ncbi:unnamed protein product [Lymnaea stagnalis]|uniref:RING-type E3 ubiquitin transferase n=1 Tax=Lymnaea stagnalis TaxID=6523 RepID=A0AAV2I8J0_LYMST
MKPGLRVVRGPNWKDGDDDGGEGHVGTVVASDGAEKVATIVWDSGTRKNYRTGKDNAYDLYVLDNAQCAVKHSSVSCDSCSESGIEGIRWKCDVCDNYDLCTECYMRDKHDTSHAFLRIDNGNSAQVRVPKRCESQGQKRKAMGIFPGATVCRGPDWTWNNQDGGQGKKGFLLHISDWDPTFRTKAGVLWESGSAYSYRVGHHGKLDLKCVEAASGWPYYKSHLPVLGKMAEDSSDDSLNADPLLQALMQEQLARPFEALIASQLLKAIRDGMKESPPASPTPSAGQPGNLLLGCRVVRGPDWKWGGQDSGEGHLGTVVDIGGPGLSKPPEKCVSVLWDSGQRNVYRAGREGAHDLRVYDNAPGGIKHKSTTCDHCKTQGIKGIRWKCMVCFNYDLCSTCYSTDKHDTGHEFWSIDSPGSKRRKVPRRRDSEKVQAKGIFVGAKVCRGQDWMYGNQDGGEGSEGLVYEIKDWDPSKSGNSEADVTWSSGTKNTYRLGHSGKVDLKCIKASIGGVYYRSHLPILGQVIDSGCDFKIGEKVKCRVDNDVVKALQQNHGGWADEMAQYTCLTGTVVAIDADDDVVVQYEDGKKWYYNQDVLTRVEATGPARDPMSSAVVKEALQMDIPKDILEKCVKTRWAEGRGEFTSLDALIETVFNMNIREDEISHTSATPTPVPSFAAAPMADRWSAAQPDSAGASANADNHQANLAEENRRLKDERMCKICMDSDACVAFVPCGHLASCYVCAKLLVQCPICRVDIQSFMRTYIA